PTSFGEEHPELVSKFLAVNAEMEDKYRADRDAMLPALAKGSGMELDAVKTTIAEFSYPTMAEKRSDSWGPAFVSGYLSDSAKKLEEAGQIKALSEYESLVNWSYLEAVGQ
ncbi:MAG: taurine ABC transporter substrate-binding protein, partial [Pseudomonadota bacterium]